MRCWVSVPLLQAWSTANSHMKKKTIASTAILFNSMGSSSEQFGFFFDIHTLLGKGAVTLITGFDVS
jgi:uncharacterized membrane protein